MHIEDELILKENIGPLAAGTLGICTKLDPLGNVFFLPEEGDPIWVSPAQVDIQYSFIKELQLLRTEEELQALLKRQESLYEKIEAIKGSKKRTSSKPAVTASAIPTGF